MMAKCQRLDVSDSPDDAGGAAVATATRRAFDDSASLDHAHALAGRHCKAQQVTLDEITPQFERQLDAKR